MGLKEILLEINKRGLTAYKIAQETTLSEPGLKKIIDGVSTPHQNTIKALQSYLFPQSKSSLGALSDYTNLEIMEYVHDNLDSFKTYPYFKTLFDIAYWKENVKEFKIAIQKGKDEASSVRDKNNHSNKF